MGAIVVHLSRQSEPDGGVLPRMVASAPHRGHSVETTRLGRCLLGVVNADEMRDAHMGIHGRRAAAVVGQVADADRLLDDVNTRLIARNETPVPPDNLAALLSAAFEIHGEDLPSRMRGIFAAVITDGEAVYCFRDHIGYKPLFYRDDASGFFAATEAKQVVAGAGISSEPDLETIDRIFYRTATDDTPAALRGVRRLPKSTGVWARDGAVRLHRYWRPEALLETGRYTGSEVQERFSFLMDQAVGRCLTGADVISLSGGIDSPAIAAFAAPRHRELSGNPLIALTVVYPQHPSVDESSYVTPLARHLDIPLHTYEQHANPLDGLDRWTALADGPFPGAAMGQYEEDYRHVRELGSRSLLTGEHAEFVFAIQWNTLDHFLTHRRFRAARRELAERRSRGQSLISLARLISRSVASDRAMALRNRVRRRHATVPAWVDLARASEEEPLSASERWTRSQLLGFIGPGVALEAEEVCQAVCGVSVRRPWTDIDLWEFFLTLPAEQKFPDLRAKGLVRDLLRGRVPDEILDRTDKTVFDEAILAGIDYETLRRFLVGPNHRLEGIDYGALGELLRTERLSGLDYQWARNLAGAHAFLSQW